MQKVADFQARVLLSILYIVLIGPYGLGMKLFADPLRLRAGRSVGWIERDRPVPNTVPQIRRQF